MTIHLRFPIPSNGFTVRDIPDCLWPTDNEYGIPSLRDDLQSNAVDLPVIMWGTVRRTLPMRGTWGFYVDDYRFNKLWGDSSQVLNSGAVNCIEPNWTIGLDTPKAIVYYRTYQKRWLARTWQEMAGTRIFVDLNVPEIHQEINLLGVPQGWRAYCTRGYNTDLPLIEGQYRVACNRAGTNDILFVVYGGGKVVEEYCRGKEWVSVHEQMTNPTPPSKAGTDLEVYGSIREVKSG